MKKTQPTRFRFNGKDDPNTILIVVVNPDQPSNTVILAENVSTDRKYTRIQQARPIPTSAVDIQTMSQEEICRLHHNQKPLPGDILIPTTTDIFITEIAPQSQAPIWASRMDHLLTILGNEPHRKDELLPKLNQTKHNLHLQQSLTQ